MSLSSNFWQIILFPLEVLSYILFLLGTYLDSAFLTHLGLSIEFLYIELDIDQPPTMLAKLITPKDLQ